MSDTDIHDEMIAWRRHLKDCRVGSLNRNKKDKE